MSNVIKVDFKKGDKMEHEYISESNQIDHKYISGEYVDEWKNSNDIGLENLKNSTRDNGIGHNNNMEEYNIRKRNKRDVTSAMDNNKLLEKYIEKMDKDQSDLRNDIRASEERTARNIELSEQRNIERFNRIENMINEHIKKVDEKYDKLADKIDNSNKYIRNISITTIIGIAAMIISILITIWMQ